jgi:hypothetical protein
MCFPTNLHSENTLRETGNDQASKQALAIIKEDPIDAETISTKICNTTKQNIFVRVHEETSRSQSQVEQDGPLIEECKTSEDHSDTHSSQPNASKFDPVRRYMLHTYKTKSTSTQQEHCSAPAREDTDPIRRYMLPPGQTVPPPPRRFYGLLWRRIVLAAVAHELYARAASCRMEGAASAIKADGVFSN